MAGFPSWTQTHTVQCVILKWNVVEGSKAIGNQMIPKIEKALEDEDLAAIDQIMQELKASSTAAKDVHTYLELKRKGLPTEGYHQLEWIYERLRIERAKRLMCKRPDRDVPGLVCGYPLPCPWHTVIIDTTVTPATVTIPSTSKTALANAQRLADVAEVLGGDD